jgi:erythromycin esterase
MKKIAATLILLLVLSPAAEARRRSVGVPNVPDETTVPGWLSFYTHPLFATEHVPFTYDLAPLRHLTRNAVIVGLGDATHGTHELFTVKLRVIEFLVREMGFDLVVFEASVPFMEELNDYVIGGPGDPREILQRQSDSVGYHFWEVEEIVEVVEWMRAYNAHRGNRPPVQIAGCDVFGQVEAAAKVISYLRKAAPALAERVEDAYACITDNSTRACRDEAFFVFDALEGNSTELVRLSSKTAYWKTLLNARAVVQMQDLSLDRDQSMAVNLSFLKDTLSTNRKVVYWAHNGHVSEVALELSGPPAGSFLDRTLGENGYYSIGTMTGGGSFLQWRQEDGVVTRSIRSFPPLQEGAYETYLRQRGASAFLLPLKKPLPAWLTTPALLNWAGSNGAMAGDPMPLPELFDAVIYIENTTPLRPLR